MKNTRWIILAILTAALAVPLATASDWGCKCIVCLSNPGGPTEYDECKPPIRKLERRLEKGGSFPDCKEAKANGYNVKKGRQECFTCEEAYGEGWQLDHKLVDVGGEHRRYEKKPYCRKQDGFKQVQRCQGETDNGQKYGCTTVSVPAFIERPLKRRDKPYYIELRDPSGKQIGERVWYKKKKKSGGGWF